MSESINCLRTRERGRIPQSRSRSGFRRPHYFVPRLESLEERLTLDATSAGVNGINAVDLLNNAGNFLDGSGIAIGQVETGRPPLQGFDVIPPFAIDVRPAAVYVLDGGATPNQDISPHAVNDAGVIIANGNGSINGEGKGIAPNADLYSSAVPTVGINPGSQHAILAMQHVAKQNNGDVPAINLSYGFDVPAGQALNGGSVLTLGLDWSASAHDTLYVVAGNEQPVNQPAFTPHFPTDEYNGVTIAATRKFAGDNVYRQVDSVFNRFPSAADGRRLVDLVAPGIGVVVPRTSNFNNITPYGPESGTSIAAPHVTAAVALLQEYADERIAAGAPGWGSAALRHEVMKAVLMNSADKLKGHAYIDMEKTILKADGTSTWLSSDALDEPGPDAATTSLRQSLPLDTEMGAGQLNVGRALTQFSFGGQLAPGAATQSEIGWDYRTLAGVMKYQLPRLQGGTYISLTLAWDRSVTLKDTIFTNGEYDLNEQFTPNALDDLDLYLMPEVDPVVQTKNRQFLATAGLPLAWPAWTSAGVR